MALDFSELNGFAPGDDSVPFDPRLITGFTGARSGQRPGPTALPTFRTKSNGMRSRTSEDAAQRSAWIASGAGDLLPALAPR